MILFLTNITLGTDDVSEYNDHNIL